jgi:hypothetical protein
MQPTNALAMVRREFLIRSTLPSEAVLAALQARSREWRESAVPAALREHGVYGVRILTDGSRFRMRSEPSWTDRFELRCRGTVTSEGPGSVIRGSIRQDNPPLWIGQFLAVILGMGVLRDPSWTAAGKSVGALVGWAIIGGIMVLLGPSHARHEAEAAEFERILEGAAWPPGKAPSERDPI